MRARGTHEIETTVPGDEGENAGEERRRERRARSFAIDHNGIAGHVLPNRKWRRRRSGDEPAANRKLIVCTSGRRRTRATDRPERRVDDDDEITAVEPHLNEPFW